jgi:transposase
LSGCQKMNLSSEVVAAILALIQDGRSQSYVARRFQTTRSTVQRVYNRFLETGSYSRRPGSGRPRKSTNRDDRFIINSSLRNRHSTAVQLRNELQHTRDVNISERTIRRRLNEANLFCRRPATGPELTREHRVARLQFAREHLHWTENDWGNVLFTDESRYCLRSPDGRERVWRRTGERYAECTFSARVSFQGGSVMVWGGISKETRTRLYLIPRGNLNAERYVNEILGEYVIPHRGLIGENFVLMHDNARPHVARVVHQYLDNENIERMDWPAHSPDLNPIEHLWDRLGRRIRALVPAPATLDELKRSLSDEWVAIPQEAIRRLVGSMPRRIEAVIQARGGNTRY